MATTFLTAEWRDLVMLNYAVSPETLRPHVPAGTELDIWNGTAFASLVAFSFQDTRLLGIPVPFHRDFEEINLRFYVRARGPEGWRRGVVFVKEVVPRRAIAAVARWVYNENYVACPTRSRRKQGDVRVVEYGWKSDGDWLTIGATVSGEPQLPGEGSEEAFISEHYWGYSAQSDGGTVEYRVEHPQWTVWRASAHAVEGDTERFYGRGFAEAFAGSPTSAFVCRGSEVGVHRGTRFSPAPSVSVPGRAPLV